MKTPLLVSFVLAALLLCSAPARTAWPVTFTLVENGSGAALRGFWEQYFYSGFYLSCTDDVRSVDGRLDEGCGSCGSYQGHLSWAANLTGFLHYVAFAQAASHTGGFTCGNVWSTNAWTTLEAAEFPLVFRLDPTEGDPIPAVFDLSIVPRLTGWLWLETAPDTGTAGISFRAMVEVRINRSTVVSDARSDSISLVPGESAFVQLDFPNGTGNDVVTRAHLGDSVAIGVMVHTFARAARSSFATSGGPPQIDVQVWALNVTAVEDPRAATRLLLRRATPNPFATSTSLSYVLPDRAEVALGVYGVDGRLVRTLERGARTAGQHRVAWDGRDQEGHPLSSGLYFARLAALGQKAVRAIVKLR